ncbi:hypothetical protein R8N76_27945 [Bacillus cereus ATCC 14579]|uniref:hypothetical protein n=1 Tax=Bacillus cereus TaxID=1396 RepID=UPI002B3150AA|nr:hypothetical protein R8N76_27945 [Bacillus cereus ATCC 14579]
MNLKGFQMRIGHIIMIFTQLDTTYKNYAKYMILRELFNRHLRFTTVKKRFYYIRDFIYHLSNHYMYYPNLIDASFLKGFLANAPSERNLADKKQAIKTFLLEIELRVPDVNFSDCYKYLNKHDSRKIKIEREQGKHKFVPLDIHNKIISLAIQDLRNEKFTHYSTCSCVYDCFISRHWNAYR